MEEATWELLLKLLLGVTDSLLSAPEAEDGLARRLCSHVLKVFLYFRFITLAVYLKWEIAAKSRELKSGLII